MKAEELKQRLDENEDSVFLLDVREDDEVAICKLPNATQIPMMEIPKHLDELPKDKDIVIYCHLSIRSISTYQYLMSKGFTNIHNLDGGIEYWALTIDTDMPRY